MSKEEIWESAGQFTTDTAKVMDALDRLQQLARFPLDKELVVEARTAINNICMHGGLLHGMILNKLD